MPSISPSLLHLCIIIITVIHPRFTKSQSDSEEQFDFQVTEESKTGTKIGTLEHPQYAGRLEFSFTTPSRYFSLDRKLGVLKVKSLVNREALCHYHSTCCPQEFEQQLDNGLDSKSPSGMKSLSNSCYIKLVVILKENKNPVKVYSVRVYVMDKNDERPKFPSPTQRIVLAENAPIGTKLRLQSAHDADSSVFATKSYKLENCDADIFNLTYSRTPGRRKGFDVNLILTKKLDREQQSQYKCRVTASDGLYSESMDVEISVEDVNDNGPRWVSNNFQTSIPEDTRRYKEILKLEATDKDEKYGLVRYQFANDYPMKSRNPFSLNMDTGVITVDRDLDYDVKGGRLYHLPVVAYDNGNSVPLSATATVTITVTDVNDNSPHIRIDENPLRIQENVMPTHLTMITVTDKDQGLNGRVTCSLPETVNEFELRSLTAGTYSLRLKKALDREALPNQGYLRTSVECVDHGDSPRRSHKLIILYVDDINDNRPRFVKKDFNVNFPESNDQGMEILIAKAVDEDRGQNAKLDYSLVDPEKHTYVAVHRHTGAITAAETFDRETRDKYKFQILVQDFGEPRLNDTANVILHITDRNDNAPKFIGGFTFKVFENTTKRTLLGRLNATDPDSGNNGSVIFFQQSSDNTFMVNTDGEVRLIGKLDREKKPHYTMDVKAMDKGSPTALFTTKSLSFEILDVNDSPPRFLDTFNSVNLSCADARQHFNVMKLEADDADTLPENRKMKFRLDNKYPRSARSRAYSRFYGSRPSSASSASSTSSSKSGADVASSKRRSGEYRFEIDPNTGAITLSHVPEICKPRNYHLSVSVYDPTNPKLSDYKLINVLIVGAPRNSRTDSGGRFPRPGTDSSDFDRGYEADPHGVDSSIDNTILFIIILICVSIIILVLMVAVVLFLRRRPEDAENEEEKEEPMRYPSQPSTCHLARKEMQPMSDRSGTMSIDDIYKHGDVELHEKAVGNLDVGKSHYKTMPSNFKEHFNDCEDDDEDKTHKALLDQQASYESQHTYQSMASQDPSSQHEYTDFNQELFSYIPDSNLNKNKKKSPHFTISFV